FLYAAVPSSARIISSLGLNPGKALTVRDAKRQLDTVVGENAVNKRIERPKLYEKDAETAVEFKNVSFSYDSTKRVLNGFNLKIKKSSFFALMGANAAGKTTALMLMGGLLEVGTGKIKLFGKNIKKYGERELYRGLVAVLPQRVHTLFAGNTVEEDLRRVLDGEKMSGEEKQRLFDESVDFFSLRPLLSRHPYDISQGEMQKAAFCMALLRQPKLLLLDEPTKGMDALFKRELGEKIRLLVKGGMTVVTVSHDSEFCAEYCDECAFICDGACSESKQKGEFFAGNFFFTTEANKISRHVFENAVTESEVLTLCKENQEIR
ncbi:MAG: ATP-binding cassette domain-containing protein, partial [Acutalibacteraceae bacterium]